MFIRIQVSIGKKTPTILSSGQMIRKAVLRLEDEIDQWNKFLVMNFSDEGKLYSSVCFLTNFKQLFHICFSLQREFGKTLILSFIYTIPRNLTRAPEIHYDEDWACRTLLLTVDGTRESYLVFQEEIQLIRFLLAVNYTYLTSIQIGTTQSHAQPIWQLLNTLALKV